MAGRNSRCTGNESAGILYNDVKIRQDEGCIYDVHTYTADATGFEGSLIYEWTLDGPYKPNDPGLHPILSSSSTYSYTFDDKTHTLYLVIRSEFCGAVTTARVKGKVCEPECEVKCLKETVSFPGGKLKSLTDNFGNIHLFTESLSFECAPASALNDKAVKAILAKLKNMPNCANAPISVRWEYNKNARNCITLTITNSSIKFTKITIGDNIYSFNTTYC
jgi:hypothetical protein